MMEVFPLSEAAFVDFQGAFSVWIIGFWKQHNF